MIHGTVASYNRHRCRCVDCTETKRRLVEKNRKAARARGYAGLTHGKRAAYDAGCRCVACRRLRSAVAKQEPYRATKTRCRLRPTGRCRICRNVFALTPDDRLYVHGPCARRCDGSRRTPLPPVRQVAA